MIGTSSHPRALILRRYRSLVKCYQLKFRELKLVVINPIRSQNALGISLEFEWLHCDINSNVNNNDFLIGPFLHVLLVVFLLLATY
jgi:hypothetical protein